MNFLSYAKALVPVAVAIGYFVNQKYGFALPTGEQWEALIMGLTGVLVYFVPNKSA